MHTFVILILLTLLFISIVFSYLFSGGETSITSSNSARLNKLKLGGNQKAELVLKLKGNKEQVISSILLGNNLANILASSISAFLAVKLLGSLGVLLSTLVMTAIVLIFAEILPKTYAINHPEKLAMSLSGFINLSCRIFYPIVKCINVLVGFLLKLFSNPHTETEIISPSDAIRSLILFHRKNHKEGNIKKSLEIISNILDITEIYINKIMIHRRDIFSINFDLPKQQIIKTAVTCDYKYVPLWKNENDNFIYILNVVKLTRDIKKSTLINLQKYLEKPIFIPETTLVSVQLHNFKVNRSDFAVVIDEYGNVIGIVTLSDILEEILEEALYTHNYQDVKQLEDNSYIVSGKMPVRDLNKKMKLHFPTQHNQTFAGMIIDEIERIPEEGEILTMYGCNLEITKKRHNRIIFVKVVLLPAKAL